MLKFPDDITKARVLIANDDGIHSQGIKVLEEAMRSIAAEVWVVAPEHEQSATGHSLTIHEPLRIRMYDDNHVSVFGTPTDSVVVGVRKVMKDNPPDLIVSGINHGSNTADDITYSGTLAAAMEGTLLGIPSVAFSQENPEGMGEEDWNLPRQWIPEVLKKFQGMEWERNVYMNVNFPVREVKGRTKCKVVQQGRNKIIQDDLIECLDPRGRPYYWIGPTPERRSEDDQSDIEAMLQGYITITPLSLNMTHYETLERLETVFS